MQDLIAELILKPFFSEKIRVFKYNSQYNYSEKLLKAQNPQMKLKGISLLTELAISYPYKRQEIINSLQKFLIDNFPQEKRIEKKYLNVLEQGIRSILNIPRYDENQHPLNIDIHQIRIEGMDLTNSNFKDTSLWGCQFYNVIFSRSNFENADLGGTIFNNCSLEYANLKRSKLCGSFMDKGRPCTFENTRLWGTNLEEAEIEYCSITPCDEFGIEKLQEIIESKKLILNQAQPPVG